MGHLWAKKKGYINQWSTSDTWASCQWRILTSGSDLDPAPGFTVAHLASPSSPLCFISKQQRRTHRFTGLCCRRQVRPHKPRLVHWTAANRHLSSGHSKGKACVLALSGHLSPCSCHLFFRRRLSASWGMCHMWNICVTDSRLCVFVVRRWPTESWLLYLFIFLMWSHRYFNPISSIDLNREVRCAIHCPPMLTRASWRAGSTASWSPSHPRWHLWTPRFAAVGAG